MTDIHEGLEGIAIGTSDITHINGAKGELIYRGYWVKDLAVERSFEEVAYLLLYGNLPDAIELKQFDEALKQYRRIPNWVFAILDQIPTETDYMAAMRAAISAIPTTGERYPPSAAEAIKIIAIAPVILAYIYNSRQGKTFVGSNPSMSHVENYLYMLHGAPAAPEKVKILETYLILSMDHSINASTFTARVVVSTESDLISSIVASIGALMGPLHGGAPSKVDSLLDEIGELENTEAVIKHKVASGERIMGFGHRVYKTTDPRGYALKNICKQFQNSDPLLKLGLEAEQIITDTLAKLKPGRKLFPNLEYWAAAALRVSGLERELYTPTFCLGRLVGWSANIIEQSSSNRLIRPTVVYTGNFPE